MNNKRQKNVLIIILMNIGFISYILEIICIMNWYKKAKLQKFAWKFATSETYVCGHCKTSLRIIDITFNPFHHFNPGQLFQCDCGKSQIWANSIRYPKELIDYCDGNPVPSHKNPEVWGFCNDEYCPLCLKHMRTLRNGVQIQSRYVDIFGCESSNCIDNKNIWRIGKRDGELEGQINLSYWYRDHQDMWRSKIQ
ncbi:MAG: hypothetical protein WC375_10545 [Methanomassiliicoccales archaeon]|jgi:hypothetical protein